MEDGKRYENMAWRLWARETFCCQPDHLVPTPQWSFDQPIATAAAPCSPPTAAEEEVLLSRFKLAFDEPKPRS